MLTRHRLEWGTAGVAVVLAVVYLVLPPMGSDLSAQVARADFFAGHGWTPIDLRWYAGVDQLGYSLVSPPVMALLGVRVTGALALVASAALLAVLFRRTAAARPWLGALVGTVCIAGNLVSGRVTYAIGVALGLGALTLLTVPRLRFLAAVAALLAGATSPVAGLFLGLAGAALLLSGRMLDGLLVAVPAAVPLGASALWLGDGGWMNISHTDTLRAVVASLVVALLVPARPVRIGAVLSALGVLAAALVHTPVGLNATRLAVMFTLPLLAAYAALPLPKLPPGLHEKAGRPPAPLWAVLPLLVVACWWQPPVVTGDVRDLGNPTADRAYFTPLLARLGQETLTGRVEIPPTRDYWESAHLGDVPLARGWLRQADIDRNPLFFADIPGTTGTGVALTADSYRTWLADVAVQFVAVPDAELTWSGRPEAALVTAGLPYLTEIWRGDHWHLYRVADPQPIVAPPATMVAQTADAVTFRAERAGDVVIRVRHYRWLRASGGAVVEKSGVWTLVRVPSAGEYTLTS
ncbi:hypothetical protein [Paractinoplanes durhamensis]|uniref:Integral membrane protein n=1 Tax=Paractinoplanes durhamensis TaxID=113563 RepID=A0ABQ3Z409_9ACTN|nr:hypothetical protein [Actinoplanes durhamensis]GIE04555.1 hypothetical protein Adu01nite_59050 [Actinoplanes durhamensis]